MKRTALVALGVAATLATAQDLTIAPVVYVMDGWTITSILDNTDSIHSLLITRETPPPDPSGNVTGVLASRGTDGWQAIDPGLVNTVFDETIDPLSPGEPRFCCVPRTIILGPTNWEPWNCSRPWTVVSQSVSSQGCSVQAYYQQVITSTRTRTCSRILWDCTTTGPTTQTQVQTGCRGDYANFDRRPFGCDGDAFTLPAAPPDPLPCGPTCGITNMTAWPQCP